MFTLQDGREHLYQWDLDRYITVNDSTICEVHFCNRTSDCSLVVEVKDGLAAIPNILLQDARPIRAYAYCDDKYTLTEKQFTVKSRTKPSDYVYTETEIITVATVEKRMDELEQSFTENIGKTVSDYIEEHPIEVDLSDYYTKAQTDSAIGEAISGIEFPETDLTGYATEQFVLDKVADIDIPEADLSNYYTKEETDTAIYNSKDAYYIYLNDSAVSEETAVKASDELQEFANRLAADRNVCLHFYDARVAPFSATTGYIAASISVRTNHIQFRASNIDPILVSKDSPIYLVIYHLDLNDNNEWMFYREYLGNLNLATQEYVDNAIAGTDVGEGGTKIIQLHDQAEEYTPEVVAYLWEYINEYQNNNGVIPNTTVFYLQCMSQQNCWVLGAKVQASVSAMMGNFLSVSGIDANDNVINFIIIYFNNDGSLQRIETRYAELFPESGGGSDVDLTNYYTKDEVNALFNGIATAEGGSY